MEYMYIIVIEINTRCKLFSKREGLYTMIRKSKKEDLNKLIKLWYEISLETHDFIDKEYWQEKREDMAQKYIPASDTYVIEENNEIMGFISMVDNYLAAIFIDKKYQNKSFGKKLIDFIQKKKTG